VSITDSELAGLAMKLGGALKRRRWRVATAESCTGGWIAKAITDVAGSSKWFEGGVVVYSYPAKIKLLGVPRRFLKEGGPGAVSEPTVRAMAEGARAGFGVALAVAVSGIAGPGGAQRGKPVGTVWFAWATAAGTLTERRVFAGGRTAVRRATVARALERLLELASA
jgi:nicotinamide-nucleotide amidase